MSEAPRKPRAVIVTRKSLYTLAIERLSTRGQARFYFRSRGEAIETYDEAHERVEAALRLVDRSLAPDQRRARVDRDDLERFLFDDDDIIVVVGQDGLVANAAKYLKGQRVIGINPDPQRFDGVLCPHTPETFADALRWTLQGGDHYRLQPRTMVLATRDDGQRLLALNEVFIGHRSHQSARYRLTVDDRSERHSSSGVIVSSGTGATGWARSIAEQRGLTDPLPSPGEPRLAWFVREPFPSVATGTSLTFGVINSGENLQLVSEMGEGGVLFADGIETDRTEFVSGQSVELSVASDVLNLVVPSPIAAKASAAPLRRKSRPAPSR